MLALYMYHSMYLGTVCVLEHYIGTVYVLEHYIGTVYVLECFCGHCVCIRACMLALCMY